MKQLTKVQTVVFLLGAALMVVGAGSYLLSWAWAPYLYTIGALCFTSMQFLQRYEGTNIVIRRLRRMMLISDFFFLLSAFLMFASISNFLHVSQITYVQFIYNKWVVTLLIAAILQLYSTHRIDHELDKEAKKL